MDLKDFISDAISEILDGIELSKKKFEDRNIMINHDKNNGQRDIEFDIALSVSDTDSMKGQTGINKIFVAKIEGSSDTTNTKVSRVKFKIPITFR